MRYRIFIFFLLILAISLRLYGFWWDGGHHLHPDERALHMVTGNVSLFSDLNPRFFNYGSLPIYILQGTSQLADYLTRSTKFTSYDGYLIIGRVLSVMFDLITLFMTVKLTLLIIKKRAIALLAGFFYAISFFPIQNSHFFVVDVLLTLLTLGVIYSLIRYYFSRRLIWVILLAIFSGAVLATKFTGIIFVISAFITLIFLSWKSFRYVFLFFLLSGLAFFIFMPYAFLDFATFQKDLMLQLTMNSNPYIFPYTLQYVGTLPYLYYLINIFLWGLGPFTFVLAISGLITEIVKVKQRFSKSLLPIVIISGFYLLYFLVVGRTSVKFMRYMLPLYPFFCLLSGIGAYHLYRSRYLTLRLLFFIIFTGSVLWSISFINIYSRSHTRIQASDWIIKNIPEGSTLAVEHWDDRLPLYSSERFFFEELPFYDRPDDEEKWKKIQTQLNNTDYIIIASNRLYIPLSRLSDCKKYRYCYTITAKYYRDLFSGKLPFRKVATFTSYPTLEIGNWKVEINDDAADESFTVYDHPKIMIFKK